MTDFLWTTFCWANQLNPAGEYSKVPLMRKGFAYHEFTYGSHTNPQWMPFNPADAPIQMALICSPSTHLLVIDVDHPDRYAETEVSPLLSREDAMSTRGEGFHIGLDMRGVHPARWPRQGKIHGADIKSSGFVPVPGSWHYTGFLYEPHWTASGGPKLIPVTEEILAALHNDRGAYYTEPREKGTGSGGEQVNGLDHDTARAAFVMHCVARGVEADAIYEIWRTMHDHNENCSSSSGFTKADFERHLASAQRKLLLNEKEEASWWAQMMKGAGA